jgi:hypothetical protein
MSKTIDRKAGEASLMQFLLERANEQREIIQDTSNRRASTAMVRDEILKIF